jgi:hypothetical protein
LEADRDRLREWLWESGECAWQWEKAAVSVWVWKGSQRGWVWLDLLVNTRKVR